MGSRSLGAVAVAATLALAVPAGAGSPAGALFTPGTSVGGVRLGMTKAQVEDAWGARHGVCRDCAETTWYFNERPFQPEGTGAVFADGRVVHAFTVWQPEGWRTPAGLTLGDQGGKIGETYGLMTERACTGYTALLLDRGAVWSVFYVFDDELWGFALVKPGRSPCL